jgi:hypothetical protein
MQPVAIAEDLVFHAIGNPQPFQLVVRQTLCHGKGRENMTTRATGRD